MRKYRKLVLYGAMLSVLMWWSAGLLGFYTNNIFNFLIVGFVGTICMVFSINSAFKDGEMVAREK